ncbi:MAG: amino acid adenylation domain-containing protein [Lachnospiraceae bacterium]|nr:amino acid adenylation domain-containing protein [Lachnospiraceae bacterium]
MNTVTDYLKNSYINYPDRVACIDDEKTLTYKELYELSDVVASNLIDKITVGTPIPLIMKKSCDALVILWGIIKAGGCYCVIDAMQPKVRIESIINTLNSKYVIAKSDSAKKLENLSCEIISPESLFENNGTKATSVVHIDTDPLYIMFTSGSTGVPKGVIVNHRSVIDFIDQFTTLFGFSCEDVIGNQAPWDFDVSVKDIFSAARVGAAIRLIPKKYFSLPVDLVTLLDKDKVTTLTWAVSALVILSSRGALEKLAPKYINKILFSGEVMPVKQYNIWRGFYPDALFVNVYGPTEITCNCTYHIVEGIYPEDSVIPAGKAFPNERVFLLSDDDKLISKDEKNTEGEICVSGTAVVIGYYNNPEETNKRFVQNPLNKLYPEIIYRTGDLAYYDENEDLVYTSRKDFQIKHMGHRIELSEIDRCINRNENVNMSCTIFHDEKIIAFVEGNIEEKALVAEMRKILPVFMIPSEFRFVESMPFNNNGKIDRKALALLLSE